MLQKRSQDFRSFFLRTVGPAPKGPPEGIGLTIIYSNGGESPRRISYIDPTGKAKPEPNFQKKTHSVKLPLPLRCFTVTLAKNLFFSSGHFERENICHPENTEDFDSTTPCKGQTKKTLPDKRGDEIRYHVHTF